MNPKEMLLQSCRSRIRKWKKPTITRTIAAGFPSVKEQVPEIVSGLVQAGGGEL